MTIKPTFIVIGAGKSGTTSLCHFLDKHSQICMSQPKEPRFFSLDENFEKGWNYYESFFPEADGAIAIGEGSVNYTMRTAYPQTASRIATTLPEVKLIYIVRHPLERIESNWRMGAWQDPNYPPFEKAIRDPSLQAVLVDRSKYWFQISAFRDYFPDDQILVVFFEDFKVDQSKVLEKCYKFLGVETKIVIDDFAKSNQALNRADARTRKNSYLSKLEQISILNKVSKLLPKEIRSKLKNYLTQKGPETPQWSLDSRKMVIDELLEDCHTFLKFYGKPIDFWNLD